METLPKPQAEGPATRGEAAPAGAISASQAWMRYFVWVAVCCAAFWKPLAALTRFALHNDNASHILIIPVIVAWLFYGERPKVSSRSFHVGAAALFAIPGVALGTFAAWGPIHDASTELTVAVLGFVLALIAGFVGVFGFSAARAAWFSLAFLVFLVPLPDSLLDRVIYGLQAGSADVAELIFDWTGTPVLRNGFVFHLSTVNIEVAKECSGIRSSIALVILALLVAHFAFSRLWKKAVFVTAGLLMMIVKNGVRIATLTILAVKVDPSFLYGSLHHQGGIVFFMIGLALLWPVYWLLRRGEEEKPHAPLGRSQALPTGTD